MYCENQAAHKDHDDLKNSILVKFSAEIWCRQDQKNSVIKNALRLGRARSLSRPSSFAFILIVYSRSRVFLIAGRIGQSESLQRFSLFGMFMIWFTWKETSLRNSRASLIVFQCLSVGPGCWKSAPVDKTGKREGEGKFKTSLFVLSHEHC